MGEMLLVATFLGMFDLPVLGVHAAGGRNCKPWCDTTCGVGLACNRLFLTTQTALTTTQPVSFSGQVPRNGSQTRERLTII